ncbi:hypothetical protein PC129_g18351 [Phytophthora cactorum]|uniref:Uncharacterized protein n=2 Tax=Phytophthora cactorum TaxID=29920 RepID=A0A329RNS5_9STRA|nr:hypothetical protein Pcac1_g9337 [Phytophthora cactorum]KAG2810009.1 hypothetical protein PC112_g16248 [Phytophthora cactorum]KAG2811633.1 hypothetical protein PC111_g15161 [Phytophthora cactorum]KAG2852559.1 hypothetical protein PC113_g14910 [Phytophthora cactorum]KAG2902196.1 hypothetical protein PC115_g15666 [Phytophthora cactorum]
MLNKSKLHKNGRLINWHDQCWISYKNMMGVALKEKGVLEYATGDKTLATGDDDAEKKAFMRVQTKVKHIIIRSLSMELDQQIMMNKTGAEIWKHLEDLYKGKTNTATHTNQEIVLYKKLQAAKCKPNWDVRQHVNNMFRVKPQLADLNAYVRDPIFINLLMTSLPSNPRFNRLRGMVDTGAADVDTPEKLKDQILRMDSYNKCDKELGLINSRNDHN